MNDTAPGPHLRTDFAGGDALPALADAVRWYEGMRLAPQHFQQQAAHCETLAALLVRSAVPLHWGLLQLAMRQDGSVITVTRVAAIMPDGSPVTSRHDDLLRLDLRHSTADADGLWRLALALPARAGRGDASDGGDASAPPRYRELAGARLPDQNAGGQAAAIALLRPNLQLVCGDSHGYATEELLPLAQFQDNGGVPRQTAYMPPWLRVGRELALYGRIELLCRQLRANYHTLSSRYGDDGAVQAGRQRVPQTVLPALAARLLELEALYEDGGAHPYQLFVLLAGLLGVLSAGVPSAQLARLPRFDYRDLGSAMHTLLAQIDQLRGRLAPDFNWARFDSGGAHTFQIDLARVDAATPCVVALHKPVRASDADMQRWFDEALVCSAGLEDDLRRRRSRGIGKTTLGAEQAARIGGDNARTLFQLDLRGEAADYFIAGALLRIVGPGGSADSYVEPLAIELLLRQPAAGAER